MAQLEPLTAPLVFMVTTAGERLDRAVVAAFPELSRALVQRLIDEGQVTLNGHSARAATKVRSGDAVAVSPLPCCRWWKPKRCRWTFSMRTRTWWW